MNNKTILVAAIFLILGLSVGTGVTKAFMSKDENMKTAATEQNGITMNHSMGGSMNSMTSSLEGKTGDDFDQAFIAGMIEHHQGAIDMANMALQSAQHQEIKDMANDIISAQSQEIDQMKQWSKSWYNQ